MIHKWLYIALVPLALVFSLCNRSQFDFSNFHGVEAEGKLFLPIAHGDYTVADMMQRFEIDSLIDYDPSGNMSFNVFVEQTGLVKGEELLRFDDVSAYEHFVFRNPMPQRHPTSLDTVFNLTQTILLDSDDIRVLSATIRSGTFGFLFTSNVGTIRKIDISSPEIKDAQGNDYTFTYNPELGLTSFGLEGLRYETNETNTLNFNYKLHVTLAYQLWPEYIFDNHVSATDITLSEMRGYIETYSVSNRVDTVFSIFPDNMSGAMAVENAVVTLSERNTFGAGALLVVDTALVWGGGAAPFPILDPLPLEIGCRPATEFVEVFQQSLDGRLDTHASNAYLTSNLTINPEGTNEVVVVCDTSSIDMRVRVNIPFDFAVDDVRYVDTVNMRLSELQSPEWIEQLTIELSFVSTIPFNLMGTFRMLDSEHGEVTCVLLDQGTLIPASYDGQPTASNVAIVIDGERIPDIMRSNRIILDFGIDTDGRNIVLKADQGLHVDVKAQVEYDGLIETNPR